jgi:hypothetical protein
MIPRDATALGPQTALMPSQRSFLTPALGAAAATACAVALACAGSAQASPRSTECQHPVTTGAEYFNAKNVSKATACKVVNALHKYATTTGNPPIYNCSGPPKFTSTLVDVRRLEAEAQQQGLSDVTWRLVVLRDRD